MDGQSKKPKILFVDDEPGILATVPAILGMHGFDVVAHSNVADAFSAMNSQQYDLLLTDLNIGEPGDGFTLVSAMRRTQPHARTMILTGFPNFQTALSAIRNQVDDYLTKPTDIKQLVTKIRELLNGRLEKKTFVSLYVSQVLAEEKAAILERFLQMVLADNTLSSVPLSDAERMDHIPALLDRAIDCMRHQVGFPEDTAPAVARGRERQRVGYSVAMLIEENRLLQFSIFSRLQERLLDLNLSLITSDLMRLSDFFQHRLVISVEAFDQENNVG